MSDAPASIPSATPAASRDAALCVDRGEVDRIIAICAAAATGDLEARLSAFPAASPLAPLALALNRMLDIADAYVRESSAAMQEFSRDRFHRPVLPRGLPGAYRRSAGALNQAGVKMRESSRQLAFVTQLADENKSSAEMVAAACEELSITTNEISAQAGEASQRTQQAVAEVGRATETIRALTAAAGTIEGIVNLISKVAGQTNLLALNATIEAARAGEAGKGFAVVASEVKELSRNTKKATEQIRSEVETMQRTTEAATQFIGNVSLSMKKLDENSNVIARSVEDQVRATQEISRSITDVADSARQLAERITAVRH